MCRVATFVLQAARGAYRSSSLGLPCAVYRASGHVFGSKFRSRRDTA